MGHNRSRRFLYGMLVFLPLLGVLSACISKYQDIIPERIRVIWDPALALPLVNTSVTLDDLLSQADTSDFIGLDNDGIITFFYSESIESDYARDLYTIPNQSFSRTVTMPPAINLPFVVDTTITFSERFEATMTPDQGELLDSIIMSTGELVTSLDIRYPANEGRIELVIPAVRSANGDTLVQVFTWVYNGTDISITETSSLDGLKLDLSNDGTDRNQFVFIANVELTYRNRSVVGGSEADIQFGLNNLGFQAVYGDLSTRSVPTASGTVPFPVFTGIDRGTFRLTDPRMTLTLENSFGLPVLLDLSNIVAIGRDDDTVRLSGSVVDNTPVLEAPTLAQVGQSVSSTITLNQSTSNLADMVAVLPREMTFEVDGTINPDAETNNFVLDTSRVRGSLDVEIPFSGTINNLTYETDLDFALDSVDLAVDSAAIVLRTVNTLPLDLDVQLYLVDADGQILDSLFTNTDLIIAAAVDGNGDVTTAGENEVAISAGRSTLDAMAQAAFLRLRVSASTSANGSTSVNLRPEYGLEVRAGIVTQFQLIRDIEIVN